MSSSVARLAAQDLVLGYESTVVHGASLELAPARVTVLIGPNGSGKSTMLRSMARLHRVESGVVQLDGSDTRPMSAREFARCVTLLSQSRPQPSGLKVRDVVAFGRHPYRKRLAGLTSGDMTAIEHAMEVTGVATMAERSLDQLSGGEVQRVWVATALAQETGVLLLDEPTNHLDLRYQAEILELIGSLAEKHGTAVGVVLHDLNHAAAVADHVVLLDSGRVRVQGRPVDVLTADHLSAVYGLPISVSAHPDTGTLRVDAQCLLTRRREHAPSINREEGP